MNTQTSKTVVTAVKTVQSAAEKTVSQKELHKKLLEMILFLNEVLNLINGNSTEQIKLTTARSKKYTALIELLQTDLQGKLKAIDDIKLDIQDIEKQQKTLSWITFGLGCMLFLTGIATAWTGGGFGLMSIGFSFMATSALEVSGAMDKLDEAVDEKYKADGAFTEEEKKSAAQEKLGWKIGIILVISLFTAGMGTAGSTANAAKAGAQTGANAAKTGTQLGQKALIFGKELLKETLFTSLYAATAFGLVEECITISGNDKIDNKDKMWINIGLTILSILTAVIFISKGKIGKAGKKSSKLFTRKKAPAAAVKNTQAPPVPPRPSPAVVKRLRNALKRRQAAVKIQKTFRGHKVRTALARQSKQSSRMRKLIDKMIRKFPSKKELFREIWTTVLTILDLIAHIVNAVLSVKKGHLNLALGGLLKDASFIKSSENLADEMLNADNDFISIVKDFIEQIQNLLKTSSENPKDYIANETEFARIFGQAV